MNNIKELRERNEILRCLLKVIRLDKQLVARDKKLKADKRKPAILKVKRKAGK